jgi:hypothetical protein
MRGILLRVVHLQNGIVVLLLSWFAGVSLPVLVAVIAGRSHVSWLFRLRLSDVLHAK